MIEYIPIRSDISINSKLEDRVTMEFKFHFHDIDGVATRLGIIEPAIDPLVSLRDIVKLLNKFLKDAKIEEIVSKKRYSLLQNTIRSNSYFKHSSDILPFFRFTTKGPVIRFLSFSIELTEQSGPY